MYAVFDYILGITLRRHRTLLLEKCFVKSNKMGSIESAELSWSADLFFGLVVAVTCVSRGSAH